MNLFTRWQNYCSLFTLLTLFEQKINAKHSNIRFLSAQVTAMFVLEFSRKARSHWSIMKNWITTRCSFWRVCSARLDSPQLNSVVNILKMFRTWQLTTNWPKLSRVRSGAMNRALEVKSSIQITNMPTLTFLQTRCPSGPPTHSIRTLKV